MPSDDAAHPGAVPATGAGNDEKSGGGGSYAARSSTGSRRSGSRCRIRESEIVVA